MSTPGFQETNFQEVVRAAKRQFVLDLHGLHGVPHWQRVRENGLRVAKHSGADPRIVELFAYLHDCCRAYDGTDSGHGERAAEFALTLRGTLIHLNDDDFALLHEAIRDHELGFTKGNVTVVTCWDADRLDLGRVGKRPHPAYLCTEYARRSDSIERAYRRSRRY